MLIEMKPPTDLAPLLRAAGRQVPFAVGRALTEVAKQGREAVRGEMMRAFDAPTPYTLGSVAYQGAASTRLQSAVFLKEQTSKGTPASSYLMPQIAGGTRSVKPFERAISFTDPASGSAVFALPGKGMKLNQYGNVSRAQVGRILKGLRTKEGSRLFVGAPKGKPRGVWERAAGKRVGVKPLLIFANRAQYQPRFKFEEVVVATVERRFAAELAIALERAMATAR